MNAMNAGFVINSSGVIQFKRFLDDGMIAHGFSSAHNGDMRDPAAIDRVFGTLGLDQKMLVQAQQVHGSLVAVVGPADVGNTVPGADGLITTARDIVLAVRTADCVPVLLYDEERTFVGAVHAGWKGIVAGIVEESIIVVRSLGVSPADLQVGLGPSIGQCCFQVGSDVAQQLAGKGNGFVRELPDGLFADLRGLVVHLLVNAGVKEQKISVSDVCTSCDADRFFSYRRDREKAGRMMGSISLS